MTQVTKDEFYSALAADKRDIIPSIQPGPYPYTSVWKVRQTSAIWGRSEGYIPEGKGLEEKRYFLINP